MNKHRVFKLMLVICQLSAIGGMVSFSLGVYVILLTDKDALGGQLMALSAFLIVTALMIGGHLSNESTRRARLETRLRELARGHESSAFRRAQDEMDLEAWNTNDYTEPPAIGGKSKS